MNKYADQLYAAALALMKANGLDPDTLPFIHGSVEFQAEAQRVIDEVAESENHHAQH